MGPGEKLNVWRPVRCAELNPRERRSSVLYGRKRRGNPELLSVYNPPLSGGAKMYVRRTSSNHPITVLYKGKLYTWQELVKAFGIKKAIKIWKKAKIKHHGRGKIKVLRHHTKHRRKHHKKAKRKHHKKRRKHAKKVRKHRRKARRKHAKKSRKHHKKAHRKHHRKGGKRRSRKHGKKRKH